MNIAAWVLFSRSLWQDSQRISTYVGRVVLVVFVLLGLLYSHTMSLLFGAPGLQFFRWVVFTNFFFITLAGLSYFASVITEEKEEMTLGLLRMTGLTPVSILLGKSTSRLVGAILFLAAQFPFTLLAFTLGGVTINQILSAYCALFAYLVFLSNLALFASVVCARTGSAAALVGTLLGAFFLLPLGLKSLWPTAAAMRLWGEASAFQRIQVIMATGFADAPIGFQFWSNSALGLFFFLLAWASFNLFSREQVEVSPAPLTFGKNSWFRWLGPRRAWKRSLMWKDFYFLTGGRAALLARFILVGVAQVAFIAILKSERLVGDLASMGWWTMAISIGLMLIELATHASRVFRSEVEWRTLASLMTLPMSVGDISKGKVQGCLLAAVPYAVFCGVGVAMVLWGGLIGNEQMFGIPLWQMIVLVLGLLQAVALLYLTAYLSLVVKRGALPLALAIMVVGFNCTFCASFLLPILLPILIKIFHEQIGQRLLKAAAE